MIDDSRRLNSRDIANYTTYRFQSTQVSSHLHLAVFLRLSKGGQGGPYLSPWISLKIPHRANSTFHRRASQTISCTFGENFESGPNDSKMYQQASNYIKHCISIRHQLANNLRRTVKPKIYLSNDQTPLLHAKDLALRTPYPARRHRPRSSARSTIPSPASIKCRTSTPPHTQPPSNPSQTHSQPATPAANASSRASPSGSTPHSEQYAPHS